jgi:hypothetical protein
MKRASAVVFAVCLAAACGNPTPAGPCDSANPAPECNVPCDPAGANTCAPGYHCAADGTCNAFCTQGGGECGDGNVCTDDGRCVPADVDADTSAPDADCPDVTFTATRVTPTIHLLLDKSGSMNDSFGSGTKYSSVQSALVDPTNGVVTTYESSVYFGATLYSQTSGNCPRLASSAGGRALNNRTAIANLISGNSPGGGTPTGPSLDAIAADYAANPPTAGSPPFVLLATDGEPFTCPDNQDNATGRMQSVAAATALFTAGIRTFVLSVGNGVQNQHLQEVANAGAGEPITTGTAPYFVADNPAELAMALDQIIGGVVSCELDLDGQITVQQAQDGTVTLNGNPLTYGTDWELVDSDTIRLLGQACTDLQNSTMPMVVGVFPCGGIIE